MTQHQQQEVDWKRILACGPYPIAAYAFVQEGLRHTVQIIHRQPESLPEQERHVSGQELCIGLREAAIEKWGLLAPVVLDHWHIRRTNDFGRIVYAMIEPLPGMLQKVRERPAPKRKRSRESVAATAAAG